MVTIERLWNNIYELGSIGEHEDGSVTRLACSKEDDMARDWLIHKIEEAGLMVHVDPVGNVIGVYEGSDPSLSPILTGSHIDTVRHAGKFDGCLGVLSSLEAVQTMIEQGIRPKRSIHVISYKDEEGNRFGFGMIGSQSINGLVQNEDFLNKDEDGITIFEAMKSSGYHPEDYKNAKYKDIHASLELHIEQGKVLESRGDAIGIVEGIAHLSLLEVTIKGRSGHAGATPMSIREDPMVAASRMIVDATEYASKKEKAVLTCGTFQIHPGSFNVIASDVTFSLDVRSVIKEELDDVISYIEKLAIEIGAREEVTITCNTIHHLEGSVCDKTMMEQLEEIMSEHKFKHSTLMSGAGHDSQNFAKSCPYAMIFVRSKDGLSHCKEEFSSKDDCHEGAIALYEMLLVSANS